MHPLVIAAHPSDLNQFALGLKDGVIVVLEPLEAERKWDTLPPAGNGTGQALQMLQMQINTRGAYLMHMLAVFVERKSIYTASCYFSTSHGYNFLVRRSF